MRSSLNLRKNSPGIPHVGSIQNPLQARVALRVYRLDSSFASKSYDIVVIVRLVFVGRAGKTADEIPYPSTGHSSRQSAASRPVGLAGASDASRRTTPHTPTSLDISLRDLSLELFLSLAFEQTSGSEVGVGESPRLAVISTLDSEECRDGSAT